MTLPLLPTSGVGSWPKKKRGQKGNLDAVSKKETAEFIKNQEQLGIDILVDGEFYRGDMATDYGRALALPIADWTRSYGNRFWKKPIVDRQLIAKEALQTEPYIYAQSLTTHPVKGMLTGPTTLANWSLHTYYRKREDRVFAYADVVNFEAKELEKAGAKYIQIDEPAIGEYHWEAELFNEGLRRAREGITAYIITHICYGDFKLVYPRLKNLSVDQIDIELANDLDRPEQSELITQMKKDPLTQYKDVAVGVIDIRPDVPVEDVDTVTRRIKTTIDILGPTPDLLQRIWIKPDCGFRTHKNPTTAYAKMKVMMDAVKKVREQYVL
ncbi:methionine synthase [Candidatus Woesearchaeota archaeon]|nr:methionine synthase [Candidatus Woesearchaeota archaeon]